MRHKVYSLINVAGLSIGIAFCILTFLYVRREWTYDTFHENAKRIYRVYVKDASSASGVTQDPLGPALEAAFPEVQTVRVGWGASSAKYQDRTLRGSFNFADPAILEVFTFPLLKGDPATVLENPSSLVISDEAARKYFGHEDPVGKVLSVRLWGPPAAERDFVISGIAKFVPKNSSIRFDFLAPFAGRGEARSWSVSAIYTFVLLPENQRPAEVEGRFSKFLRTRRGEQRNETMGLQPLLDLHLGRGVPGLRGAGNPALSYVLLGIALLVLANACVNFITLAVGRSFSRDREVAMRKTAGASRAQLLIQFLGESTLLSLIAVVAGVGLAELLLPVFNGLIAKDLALVDQADGVGLAFLLGLAAAVGMAAGGYPALALSGFQPVSVWNRRLTLGTSSLFGRALVVFQFALSVFLVVSALVMVQQLEYLRTKPLGFESASPRCVFRHWILLQPRFTSCSEVYRNELMRHHSMVLGM